MMRLSDGLLGGGVEVASDNSNASTSTKTLIRRNLPARVKHAVFARDRHICRGCGFRSEKYQEVIVLGGAGRDLDMMVTACIFCHQAFHLDRVPNMRSGVLVWLPEVDQVDLHHLAREIYLFRRSPGSGAEKAGRAYDHIMTRKEAVKDRFGSPELESMIALLRETSARGDRDDRLEGIRLMPLDRRILTEGDLENNQFPAILAHWRSVMRAGSGLEAHPRIDAYLDLATTKGARSGGSGEPGRSAFGDSEVETVRPRRVRDLNPPGYPWAVADAFLRETVLRALDGPIDGILTVDDERTEVSSVELPWYPWGTLLIRLTDRTWPVDGLAVYYLVRRGQLYRLSGDSPPIHEINSAAPIRLDEENVLDYLRFFCFFVRGEEGPFYVAEATADPMVPKGLHEPSRMALETSLRPATYEGQDEAGRYLCDAVIFYSDTLFRASFAIEPAGSMLMLDDEPIAANLGVRIRAPIKYEDGR